MAKENKKYKDSVFCDLFYSDINAEKNLMELYNALFDEKLTDVSEIQKVRLENVLFMDMKNDVAFTACGKRIILSEQQSTVNPNMPLRMLLYIAREYETTVPGKTRYSKTLYRIPTPSFVVFYNGKEDQPAEKILKLSDAYIFQEDSFPELDLSVRMININPGRHHPILKKSEILRQYSEFVDRTRRCAGEEKGLKDAVYGCIRDGILSDYLERKSKEVINMLMETYDYEKDIEVNREEAKAEGKAEGKVEVYYTEMHMSVKDIAKKAGISVSQTENILIQAGLLPKPL